MKNKQKGVSLIEAMVSLIVLSIGMLGMVALQSKALQANQSSYYRTQIAILAEDIMDRMRANKPNASLYKTGFNDAAPISVTECASSSANCSGSALADYDLAKWKEDVASLLPSGKAQIVKTEVSASTEIYVVTLQYDDSSADNSSSYAQTQTSTPKQFSFRTEI